MEATKVVEIHRRPGRWIVVKDLYDTVVVTEGGAVP